MELTEPCMVPSGLPRCLFSSDFSHARELLDTDTSAWSSRDDCLPTTQGPCLRETDFWYITDFQLEWERRTRGAVVARMIPVWEIHKVIRSIRVGFIFFMALHPLPLGGEDTSETAAVGVYDRQAWYVLCCGAINSR